MISALERHGRSIIFIAIALVLAGIFAATTMAVGLFPQVSFPRVVVSLDAGDRPAEQMALLVTRPVEEAIRAVPGVRNVRSETTRGSAQVSVDFGWGRDMTASTLLIDAALSRILATLPPGTVYDVERMDPNVFPVIAYALQSDKLDGVHLKDLATFQIVPLLSGVQGLARVSVQGGATEEIRIEADVHRLETLNLGLADISAALANSNAIQAVGRIQDNDRLYLAVADTATDTIDKIKNVVLQSDAAGLVRLGDVATVSRSTVPEWVRVSEDGKPAVLLNVFQQPDGNAVQLATDVRNALASLKLPTGVRLVKWYDQSDLVLASAASVRDAVIIGLVLAAMVLFVFLRSWRLTLVAVVVVPAVLAVTILVLRLLGLTFNIMTLGGIAAAVGLLIDDVIVMVEHIEHRLRSTSFEDRHIGILASAREFLVPLAGSSGATLIVFVPLGLLSGVTGAFSKALSVTMGSALVISFLATTFVVPLLARFLLRDKHGGDAGAQHRGLPERWHLALLEGFGRRRWLLAALLVPLIAIGFVASQRVSTGFMPAIDEGGFVLDYYTRPGTSLVETDRELAEVEDYLRNVPEIATFSRRLGTGLGGTDVGQSYHGDFFIRLKPDHARSTEEVMSDVSHHIELLVPGVEVELAQLMEDLIGDLTAVPQPIEIKLAGASEGVLNKDAVKVADAIRKIDGVTGVKDGINLAGDAIDVRIDPARAAFDNVSTTAASQQINDALTGAVATQIQQGEKIIGVRVVAPGAMQARVNDLRHLPIRAADGHILPLSRIADIRALSGQPQISRENLQTIVAVTGRIEGRGLGATIADVKNTLTQPGLLSPGVSYTLGGLYEQQQIAFAGLIKVFVMAIAAEFILLLFLYEGWWQPTAILATSLISVSGVFVGLWICGVDLNVTAMMGMTMVIGIGTEMAIFYMSEFTRLSQTMNTRDALYQAAVNRLRAITMTTLAAILTLLPLALAIGRGSEMQQPLAIAIISGLILQYPLVLVGLPILTGLSMGRYAHSAPSGYSERQPAQEAS